ncbi:MAG TPA: hydroxymethylbilane synthase [Candidatus Poseidoniales archaeon]|nr:MAG TPA: hydroxymethylbilane synthase [Candidatus Poseidoniales archaeon]HII58924.1 hydroxymethylbilane synthase [Candidatus Poseidoniaceae archaeon]
MTQIKIGTRTSTLAMWQANKVRQILQDNGCKTEIIGISSQGDKSLGGDLASTVGQFIHAVDSELIAGNIDIAVHSSKDVPVKISDDIVNLAYLERGCTNDLLIFPKSKDHLSLGDLLNTDHTSSLLEALAVIPKSGTVGTVSGRRQSFILSQRPDVIPIAVRGQVETRLKRLRQGRVDAIVLAEIGLLRLHEIGALEPWILDFSAVRISDEEWPTAPGQGAISVHCRALDVDMLNHLRTALNHQKTADDVSKEREILTSVGGGCQYPAGIKVDGDEVSIQVSPQNWREVFCQGLKFDSMKYHGPLNKMEINLPSTQISTTQQVDNGPKLISTLNSNRLARILQNDGINVLNQPVIELIPKADNWPSGFIDNSVSRSQWPYLVLTSPFAAKCAIEVAKTNGDLNRIQWLAIGEGTARACFMRGVTVSICAKSRDSVELTEFIKDKIERNITLMIPRSNVGSTAFVDGLTDLGFNVKTWVGYENQPKQVDKMPVADNDVLLLSSPSSARAWVENDLPIPKNILCMGKASQEEIESLQNFANSTVEVLQGPTAEFVAKWWKSARGE